MKKENFLSLTIFLLLVAGMVVTFIYSYNKNQERKKKLDSQYQFYVIDDSAVVYNNERFVGTIKMDGSLDSLIIIDNQ